ncbi:RHS repeat protein [bacterium]|nr:RHS repeat protein [bacterium]
MALPRRTYSDVTEIILVNTSGIRYVFGLPLRSETVLYGGQNNSLPRFIVEYTASWQLTCIASPECNMIYQLIPGTTRKTWTVGDTLAGNWIKFEYNYPVNSVNKTVRAQRPLYYYRDNLNHSASESLNQGDPFGLLSQTTYPSKITTPTHEAIFQVSSRYDISFLYPIPSADVKKAGTIGDYTTNSGGTLLLPLRLDYIILKQRYPYAANVSLVKFDYAPEQQELCRFGVSTINSVAGVTLTGKGRTTLRQVSISDSVDGYYYRFGYTDSIDNFNPAHMINPNLQNTLGPLQAVANVDQSSLPDASTLIAGYYRLRSGRTGLLYAQSSETGSFGKVISDTKGMAAWSLRTIEYPTGIVDTIAYEPDEMDKATSMAGSALMSTWWDRFAPDEAGIRVRYIASYDPTTGETRRISYQYPLGILPGLPVNYLRNSSFYTGTGNRRVFQYGYSSDELEYPYIITVNSDSSKTKTTYTTPADLPGSFNLQITKANYIHVEDKSWQRGKVRRVEQFDAAGRLISRSSNEYTATTYFPAIWKYNPYPFVAYYYYINGKKIVNGGTWMKKTDDTTYVYDKTTSSSTDNIALTKIGYYNYNNPIPVLKFKIEKTPTLGILTNNTYAYENSAVLQGKNILSALSYKEVRHEVAQWVPKNVGGDTIYILQTYSYLKGAAKFDVTTDGYTAAAYSWLDGNLDGESSSDEFVLVKKVTAFDNFANPLTIQDANGQPIQLEWSPQYQNARLTKRTVFTDGIGLIGSFTYDKLHQLSTQTDENGAVTSYQYDGLGRLKQVIAPGNKLLKSYDYHIKKSIAIPFPGTQY